MEKLGSLESHVLHSSMPRKKLPFLKSWRWETCIYIEKQKEQTFLGLKKREKCYHSLAKILYVFVCYKFEAGTYVQREEKNRETKKLRCFLSWLLLGYLPQLDIMADQLLQLSVLQPPVVKNSMTTLFSNISYYIDEFLTMLHSSRLVGTEHGVPLSLEAYPFLGGDFKSPSNQSRSPTPDTLGVRALHNHVQGWLRVSVTKLANQVGLTVVLNYTIRRP
jgi:hypothetical protein